jgi:hypothetical protein
VAYVGSVQDASALENRRSPHSAIVDATACFDYFNSLSFGDGGNIDTAHVIEYNNTASQMNNLSTNASICALSALEELADVDQKRQDPPEQITQGPEYTTRQQKKHLHGAR